LIGGYPIMVRGGPGLFPGPPSIRGRMAQEPSFDALDRELAHCAEGVRAGAGVAPLEHGRRVIAALLRHPDWEAEAIDYKVQLLQQGGGLLLHLFKARGDRSVLEEAVKILTLGVNSLDEDHRSRPPLLANLGLALRIAGEHDSDPKLVQRAIACLETSIAGTELSDGERPKRFSNLGNAWRTHHDLTGDPASLDQGIIALDKAFALRPTADLASNLSVGFRDRFARSGSRADLEQGLHLAASAVEATAPEDPGLPVRLNNLSLLHAHRFELDRRPEDGKAALDLLAQIVELTPEESPDLGYRLLNLGNMHRRMFGVTGNRKAIAFAAKVYSQALAVARYGSDGTAMIQSAYADALSVISALEQDVEQGAKAIDLARQALASASPGHVERLSYQSSLAQAMQRQGRMLGDIDILREAEAVLSGYLENGPHTRPYALLLALNRARIAADIFALSGDASDAHRALRVAKTAIRAVQARAVEGSLERANIELAASVATEMAVLMARVGDAGAAAECLESARTARFNADATAANRLPVLDAPQEEEFEALQGRIRRHRAALETPGGLDQVSRAQTAAALDADLGALHGLVGRDPLARALDLADIQVVAAKADAVLAYLHANDDGGIAVLVSAADIGILRLPDLAHARRRLHAAVAEDGTGEAGWFECYAEAFGSEASEQEQRQWRARLAQTLDWLGRACAAPLGEAVTAIGGSRLILLASDELALLPIHAAPTADGRPLSAYFKCSVAPSAGLLAAALESPAITGATLAVGDAEEDLPFARIEARIADPAPLLGQAASLEAVSAALGSAARVHLAVHGRFDRSAPLNSAFQLADDRLSLAALLAGDIRLRPGATVVASACESGQFDREVGASEQMGFGAALLAAGARRAVVSLWPVNDLSTVLLMKRMLEFEAAGAPLGDALSHAAEWLRGADRTMLADALGRMKASLPIDAIGIHELLDEAGREIASGDAHPFSGPENWAAFVAIGAPV